MKNNPRILFTTPVLGYPSKGGPELRIENSIKALSHISDLYIYSQVPIKSSGITFYKQYCKELYLVPPKKFFLKCFDYVKHKANIIGEKWFNRPFFKNRPDHNLHYKKLIEIAEKINADVIWLGYGNISYPLLKLIKSNSKYKVVCDTDSVWSRFILRGLPYAQNEIDKRRIEKEGKEKEEEEQWGTQLADVTTAVSEVDAEYYRNLAKTPEQIKIFSNVIDLKNYNETMQKPLDFKKPCIYLAGTFFEPHCPMDEAARWIIKKVLPLIKIQVPDIHFYIIGNGLDKILNDINDPSITITGQLPSVLPYLCHANVAIVPLKFESGTRFKILEAGACNIPVVSTTLGAEGIPVTHGVDILIADEPENFAREVIKVISDLEYAKQIGSRLNVLIEEKYSIPALVREGNIIINSMLDV